MIFQIKTTIKNARRGYEIAQDVLHSSEFHERILDVVKFTYTKDHPSEVYIKLKNALLLNYVIPVNDYRYRSQRVIATTFKGDPGIYVNTNGADKRDVSVYLANACHEVAHVPLGYGHGSNFPPGSWRGRLIGDWEDKNLSVPHTLARIGVEIAIKKGLF